MYYCKVLLSLKPVFLHELLSRISHLDDLLRLNVRPRSYLLAFVFIGDDGKLRWCVGGTWTVLSCLRLADWGKIQAGHAQEAPVLLWLILPSLTDFS